MSSYGRRIKTLRNEHDLTQEEFSEKFGLSLRSLQNWEQEHREPDPAAQLVIQMIEVDADTTAELVKRAKDRNMN